MRDAVGVAPDDRSEKRLLAQISVQRVEPEYDIRHFPGPVGNPQTNDGRAVCHHLRFDRAMLEGVEFYGRPVRHLAKGLLADLSVRLCRESHRDRQNKGYSRFPVHVFIVPQNCFCSGMEADLNETPRSAPRTEVSAAFLMTILSLNRQPLAVLRGRRQQPNTHTRPGALRFLPDMLSQSAL